MEIIAVYNCRADEEQMFDSISKKYGFRFRPIVGAPYECNIQEAKGCSYVSVSSDAVLTRKVLEGFKANGVQHIASRSIGIDHIPLNEAKQVGITVSNITYSPSSVADYAILLMLMVCRKIKPMMQRMVANDYRIIPGIRGMELRDKTIGILGTGRIGATVAKHLRGFPVRLIAYDRFPSEEMNKIVEYVSLDELYKQSDIITIHVPATEENIHMINKDSISMMKDGVILINTARGTLIDSNALIEGLESGRVIGAGLDVVDGDREIYYRDRGTQILGHHEMAILNSFPNVLLLPHMAFFTDDAVKDMVENAVISCKCHRDGEKIPCQVV